MTTPANRFKGWMDSLALAWQARLKEWMASGVEWSFEKLFDAFEPGIREEIKPQLEQLKAIPNLPPEWHNILDKATEASSFIQFAALAPYLIGALFGLAMGAVAPISRWGSYPIDKQIHSYRLDPMSVITAWRRDPATYAVLFDDLKDQGWSDERIKALKFFTLYYPSPAELIHWTAREVFEPDKIAKYGLMADADKLKRDDFYKAGMDDPQIDKHWIAHWEHASWMQMVEMLHREIITEQDVKDWFPLVEMAPYWAENLIQTAYTWPTRVDVRRWWDLRTIDEVRLTELYKGMGYRGKNLDDYVLWTKVYVAFPDIIARVKNGWINEAEAKIELAATGLEEPRLTELWETRFKKVLPERVEEGRALTKAEIYKGVKAGLITWGEGVELLEDMGYDEDEAEYLVEVNVGALTGSPHTYEEFKAQTQMYRKAVGMPAKPISEELKKAGAEVVKLTGDVKTLEEAVTEEKRGLIETEGLPEAATEKLRELQAKLHRAESALAAAQTNYKSLVAQWRYSEAE